MKSLKQASKFLNKLLIMQNLFRITYMDVQELLITEKKITLDYSYRGSVQRSTIVLE